MTCADRREKKRQLEARAEDRRLEPDVIPLDLRMPHLDGIEMLKMLRSTAAGRGIPVIVTTGMKVDPSVRLLADYVLVKPFGSDELAVALASCASRHSTRDASVSTGGRC